MSVTHDERRALTHPELAPERTMDPAAGCHRIAMVLSSLKLGGAERVACRLTAAWAAAGHDVTVITVYPRSDQDLVLAQGVRRIALGLSGDSRNVLEGALQASRRALAVRSACAAIRPDVVVSFLHTTNVVTLIALVGTGLPIFVSERSDPTQDRIPVQWEVLRRFTYPRAAGVVVQTQAVAAWARRFCRRVHVIPNFVERPGRSAEPAVDHGPRRIVAAGRLTPEKGFDLLISAFAQITGDHPDWTLVILGEGPERRRLEDLVTRSGLGGHVFLPGSVSDPEAHFAAAHLFALPSRYEGFPNALIEAMASGLPVVAFNCRSGPGDIIHDGEDGVLVEPGNVTALAAALDRLMSSPADRGRLGARASAVIERLAPSTVLKRWSALFDDVERR